MKGRAANSSSSSLVQPAPNSSPRVAAFSAPLVLAHRQRFCSSATGHVHSRVSPHTISRVQHASMSLDSTAPSSPAPCSRSQDDRRSKYWDGFRQVIRVSTVSLGVLFCSMRGVEANSSQVHVPRDAAGDVEAAAVTLGAVTVGGLVMRAVLASRRDEDKEREELAAECARLEEEEVERSKRLKRKAMERVEGSDQLPEDEALLSSLQKRLQDGASDGTSDSSSIPGILLEKDDEDEDEKKKHLRNSAIPDRGAGSMLLERPDGEGEGGDGEERGGGEEDETAKKDSLEMLNRMWNISSDSNEERKKP